MIRAIIQRRKGKLLIWKKWKYISDNMQKFLNFTKMYYREHPLIQKL